MQSFIKLIAVCEVAVCFFPINVIIKKKKKKVEMGTSEPARWAQVKQSLF